jgi:hypothetical protein
MGPGGLPQSCVGRDDVEKRISTDGSQSLAKLAIAFAWIDGLLNRSNAHGDFIFLPFDN